MKTALAVRIAQYDQLTSHKTNAIFLMRLLFTVLSLVFITSWIFMLLLNHDWESKVKLSQASIFIYISLRFSKVVSEFAFFPKISLQQITPGHNHKLLFSILENIRETVKMRLSTINNNLINIPKNREWPATELRNDDDVDVARGISRAAFSDSSHPPTHATCSSGMYGGIEPRRKLNLSLWTGPGWHWHSTTNLL